MHLIPASPGYPRRAWARVVAGRLLEAQDLTSDRPVVVDQPIGGARTVRRSSAGRSGLGGDNSWERQACARASIGVVEDVHYDGLDAAAGGASLSVRGIGCRSASCRSWFGRPVRRCNPSRRSAGSCSGWIRAVPLEDVVTLDKSGQSLDRRPPASALRLPSASALLTLTIAVLGLVAVLMRSIAERRHELAIRAAIGSSPAQTRRSVLRTQRASQDWGSPAVLPAPLPPREELAHSLFGVRPHTIPLTFGGIAVAILVVALLACLIPGIAREPDRSRER